MQYNQGENSSRLTTREAVFCCTGDKNKHEAILSSSVVRPRGSRTDGKGPGEEQFAAQFTRNSAVQFHPNFRPSCPF